MIHICFVFAVKRHPNPVATLDVIHYNVTAITLRILSASCLVKNGL